jgi:predicted metal-binding membrane protein
VDGVTPQPTLERGIEATLRRDRRVVTASLVLVVGLAWLYLWRDSTAMSDMGMAGMPMAGMLPAPGIGALSLTFAMWTVMMIGMMLPSVAPVILLYGAIVRRNAERGTVLPAVWVFTSGYVAAWAGFSLVATLLQVALEQTALVTPAIASASSGLSAAILIAAGIYQWLPLKAACLNKCRTPLGLFVTRWRTGTGGAFRMGAEHGLFCVGCCWMLMLLLFVAGVMNLVWVALIAAFVFVEKLLPAGKLTARFAGVALVVSGLFLLIKP